MSDNNVPRWRWCAFEQIPFSAADKLSKLDNVTSYNFSSGFLGAPNTTSTNPFTDMEYALGFCHHFFNKYAHWTLNANVLKKAAACSGWNHHERSPATEGPITYLTSYLANRD